MRILFVSHLHPPIDAPLENMGGMQRVSMQLIDALAARSDVVLEPVVLHAKWKGIGMQTFRFLLRQLVDLPKKVKSFQADVVLFSSMVTGALAPLVRSRIDVPMVAINHGRDVTLPVLPYQWYLPTVFRNLDRAVSVSEATSRECLKRGLSSFKSIVLPNGFPVADNVTDMGKAEARSKLSLITGTPLDGKVVLTVGRQVKRKGHRWFLREVLPLVQTPLTWLVVGDGPEHALLTDEAAKTQGAHRIVLLGRVADELLDAAYLASDLFVMPNIPVLGDMEGFGVVMLEANAKGLPVVAADLEGISDVVTEGVSGHLVKPLNPIEFAQKVDAVLKGESRFEPEDMRHYVKSHFGWEGVAGRYVDLLRGLIPVSSGQAAPNLIDRII